MSYLSLSLLGLQIDLTIESLPLAASVAHHYYLATSFIRNLKLSLLLCAVWIELSNLFLLTELKPVFDVWIQSLGLINIDLSTLNS